MTKKFPKEVYVYWFVDGEDSWINVCEDERKVTEEHGKWTLVGRYELKSVDEICTVEQPVKIKRRPVKQ